MLNLKSDDSRSGELVAAAKVVTDERAAVVLASKKASMWEFPPVLDATQVLQGHTLPFISTMLEDYFLYEMCRYPSVHMWLPVWRSRLCLTD